MRIKPSAEFVQRPGRMIDNGENVHTVLEELGFDNVFVSGMRCCGKHWCWRPDG